MPQSVCKVWCLNMNLNRTISPWELFFGFVYTKPKRILKIQLRFYKGSIEKRGGICSPEGQHLDPPSFKSNPYTPSPKPESSRTCSSPSHPPAKMHLKHAQGYTMCRPQNGEMLGAICLPRSGCSRFLHGEPNTPLNWALGA